PDVRRVGGSLKRMRRRGAVFFAGGWNRLPWPCKGAGPMRLIAVTVTCLGLIASGVIGARAAVHGQTLQSQWDRVYSLPQAKRGEALYQQHCAACHAGDLTGGEIAPALTGGDFASTWNELTLGDLFERIRVSMPQGDPMSLSR